MIKELFLNNTITLIFTISILFSFILAFILSFFNQKHLFVSYAPVLLSSLGICGTFAGIFIGLYNFNADNIDGSIPELLNGMKTAFSTSLLGMFFSIVLKLSQSFRREKNEDAFDPVNLNKNLQNINESIGFNNNGTVISYMHNIAENINNSNRELIEKIASVVGGEGEVSILTQMQKTREVLRDFKDDVNKSSYKISDLLSNLCSFSENQKDNFKLFSDKLWFKFDAFTEILSKSATETIIDALKNVISDFNNNLTEQFGDNFKKLNQSVDDLVKWQENYKQQLSEMKDQFELSTAAISNVKEDVTAIAHNTEPIKTNMESIYEIIGVAQEQVAELSSHLRSFSEIRDKAVSALPEINTQIKNTVDSITNAANRAGEQYRRLLTDTEQIYKDAVKGIKDLGQNFNNSVAHSLMQLESDFKKQTEKTNEYYSCLINDADKFRNDTVNVISSSISDVKEQIKNQIAGADNFYRDLLDDVSNHQNNFRKTVASLVNNLQEEIAGQLSLAGDFNRNLLTDAENYQKKVIGNIGKIQNEILDIIDNDLKSTLQQSMNSLKKSLEEQVSRNSQQYDIIAQNFKSVFDRNISNIQNNINDIMKSAFSNIAQNLENQVKGAREDVTKQLSLIDKSMEQEITRVMQAMGKALSQITGQFVKDYTSLTSQMRQIISAYNNSRR